MDVWQKIIFIWIKFHLPDKLDQRPDIPKMSQMLLVVFMNLEHPELKKDREKLKQKKTPKMKNTIEIDKEEER